MSGEQRKPIPTEFKLKLLKVMQELHGNGLSIAEACRRANIGRTTFYKYREQAEKDANLLAAGMSPEQIIGEEQVIEEAAKTIDTLAERKGDLDVLNRLLDRLFEGIDEEKWTPEQIHDRVVQLIDAKGRLLTGVDRTRHLVQSLTLVDARSITLENLPESVRNEQWEKMVSEIYDNLCPACKEACETW